MKRTTSRILLYATGSVTLLALLVLIGFSACYVYLEAALPSVETMRSVELQVPLRV